MFLVGGLWCGWDGMSGTRMCRIGAWRVVFFGLGKTKRCSEQELGMDTPRLHPGVQPTHPGEGGCGPSPASSGPQAAHHLVNNREKQRHQVKSFFRK